jgi:hypothetical protein
MSPEFSCCRNLKQFQSDLVHETETLDTLLQSLYNYYQVVKTKQQLNLEVPAGVRHSSITSQALCDHKSTIKSSTNNTSLDDSAHSILLGSSTPSTSSIDNSSLDMNSSNTNSSSDTIHTPLVRAVDKPSTSLPETIMMTEDFIRACVGFCRIDTLKNQFSNLYLNTIRFDKTPEVAVLDQGLLATMRKSDRNTTPVPRPSHFGEVMHMDIVFEPEISVGNIHYGLLFTDCYSRMTYGYPLHNLATDIPKQLESFFAHITLGNLLQD